MLSAVLPCFNESEVLRLTYQKLVEAAPTWGDSVEFLFIDDGSTDGTWDIIEDLARQDSRVRGIRLSRNFGQHAALGAGLEQVRGDVVVILDADLQDPPSLVNEMLAKWREGYDVVYAQRKQRHGETWFKMATANLFYRMLSTITGGQMPRNTSDFSLLDARVAKTLIGMKEHALFWRGLRTWVGFRQTAVLFDRPERAAGTTKWGLRKLIRLAANAILNFSELPLQLPLYAGFAGLGLTFLAAVFSVVCGLTGWSGGANGWVLGLFFLGSVQLVALGFIGEYLNRIYEEVRNRPRWIIDRVVEAGQAAETTRRAA